jgi:hypothetical protein
LGFPIASANASEQPLELRTIFLVTLAVEIREPSKKRLSINLVEFHPGSLQRENRLLVILLPELTLVLLGLPGRLIDSLSNVGIQ